MSTDGNPVRDPSSKSRVFDGYKFDRSNDCLLVHVGAEYHRAKSGCILSRDKQTRAKRPPHAEDSNRTNVSGIIAAKHGEMLS